MFAANVQDPEPSKEPPKTVPAQNVQRPSQDHLKVPSSGWVWIKVGNNVSTSWDVTNGPAEVNVDGEKFSAKLYWADNPAEVKISLNGTIQSGKIRATEVVHNTDMGESVYSGTSVKSEYVQTVNLSDEFSMIGLTLPSKK